MNVKGRKIVALFFSLCFSAFSARAESSRAVPDAPESGQPAARQRRYPVAAAAGGLFSNVLLFSFNYFVAKNEFARISADDIWENLTGPPEWDGDVFATNQFAHPYQGSTYHAAARANGFGFYESIFFDALGSVYWEYFTETTTPSINDLISTTISGASLGEMFHRLYLEVAFPVGGFISPLDAFNGLVTRRRQEKTAGKNIHKLSVFTAPGWTGGRKSVEGGNVTLERWNTAAVNVDCDIVYGDPFEQRSVMPFDHFEMNFGGGISLSWYNMYIISDAYLFSFSPDRGEKSRMTTGLNLSYDFFTSLNIDFYSEGLDWAVKYQRFFSEESGFEVKAHAGWTMFGAGNIFIPNEKIKAYDSERDYGTGFNSRLFFSFYPPRAGRIDFNVLVYGMYIISHRIQKSRGWDFFFYSRAAYTFPLGRHLSLGLGASAGIKTGVYPELPNIVQWTDSVQVFVEWNFYNRARLGRPDSAGRKP
ncbi:MAG: DUF3943 domain-containing protein [Treponema sp.]|nr:DUF3943 domain-containing protein [Treponema sp.]